MRKCKTEARPSYYKKLIVVPHIFTCTGAHRLVPVIGYYCTLCSVYSGDQFSAEEHLTSESHNRNYKQVRKFLVLNVHTHILVSCCFFWLASAPELTLDLLENMTFKRKLRAQKMCVNNRSLWAVSFVAL